MQIQGQYAPSGSSWYNSAAAEETHQVKAGAGLLYALLITNLNAAARFAFVFDSLTATGTPIVPPIPLTAVGASGSQVRLDLSLAIPFNTGCFVAMSSTGNVFTAAGAADMRMTALYK